ncbi:MAG: hemerythrin domain-containing protein [Candidatus Aminicenantes bacterium]|nr:hemerythrin domain-containing protein [Candidatus Aminicenantes bacterium]
MKQKDLLDKLINDHEEVSEYVENLKGILDLIHDKEAWRKIKPIEDFFNKNVTAHFAFEEKNVFPVCLLKFATPETVKLILELQKEHGIISSIVEEFMNITAKKTASYDEDTSSQLNFLGRKIFDLLLNHASKEDDNLLPILEKNREIFKQFT